MATCLKNHNNIEQIENYFPCSTVQRKRLSGSCSRKMRKDVVKVSFWVILGHETFLY